MMIWQQGMFIYNNRPQNQNHSTIISVVCSQSPAFLLLKPYADLIVAIWHHLSLCRTALMFDWVLLCCFVYLLLVFLVEECLEMLEMALRNISNLARILFCPICRSRKSYEIFRKIRISKIRFGGFHKSPTWMKSDLSSPHSYLPRIASSQVLLQ